ncbi:MAG: L-rhamnose isomerase [Eubacteriales bacterium]
MSDTLRGYELAKEIYASYGIDADKAMEICGSIPISVHCWQTDDGKGLEGSNTTMSGGIQATGNHPKKATNFEEITSDLEKALSYVPGVKKVNVHAIYLDNMGEFVDRDQIETKHFNKWIEWANKNHVGLDFNNTFYSHPLSENGYTLSSSDENVRAFWIEHGKRSRKIAAYIAEKTGKPVVLNTWIPDGEKEIPIDTLSPRLRLIDSLDQMFAEKYDNVIDSVESKLFGLGSEAYVVGSHEFYLGYALKRDLLVTFDTGHFHPTEMVSMKISAVLPFLKGLLLHVSRPVRWDSDHVVNFDDETRNIMTELVRLNAFDKVIIALDYFDASVNRVIALAAGARNTRKALLEALLQPNDMLKELERSGNKSARLAYSQEIKSLPFGLVWDYYCQKENIMQTSEWIEDALEYEKNLDR